MSIDWPKWLYVTGGMFLGLFLGASGVAAAFCMLMWLVFYMAGCYVQRMKTPRLPVDGDTE